MSIQFVSCLSFRTDSCIHIFFTFETMHSFVDVFELLCLMSKILTDFRNVFRRISLIYNPILWHTVAPYSIALQLAYVGDWKSAGDAD